MNKHGSSDLGGSSLRVVAPDVFIAICFSTTVNLCMLIYKIVLILIRKHGCFLSNLLQVAS